MTSMRKFDQGGKLLLIVRMRYILPPKPNIELGVRDMDASNVFNKIARAADTRHGPVYGYLGKSN